MQWQPLQANVIEVRADTYIEALNGDRRMINRAYIGMVVIDQDEQPVQVPRLIVETETQRAEWEGGKRRYALPKKRREVSKCQCHPRGKWQVI